VGEDDVSSSSPLPQAVNRVASAKTAANKHAEENVGIEAWFMKDKKRPDAIEGVKPKQA